VRRGHVDEARAPRQRVDDQPLVVCDGSVFPTGTAVNPSLTIEAIAARTADRLSRLARRGELS
jgi:choline dehydrogenase-like flavoprotein